MFSIGAQVECPGAPPAVATVYLPGRVALAGSQVLGAQHNVPVGARSRSKRQRDMLHATNFLAEACH